MTFRAAAGVAGIVTAVIGLALVFFPVSGEFPNSASSAKQIGTFYAANSGSVVAQSIGSAVLFILITVFAAGLWATLRDGERELGEAWAVIGLLGATATAASYTVAGAMTLTLARRANEALAGQDAALVALFDVQNYIYGLGAAFLAMYLVGFSIAGQRSRAMPRWLSGLGYLSGGLALVGVVQVAAPRSILDLAFYLATLGFLAWTLVGGIRLVRAARAATAQSARQVAFR
jgi:hypothetical protein